ncbi:hypothetical protein B0H12DRAFT_519044 [Mycena haematopus]|nr:hypothetical protein B0H12DRAFT_519044 [Mycena haematopus]
MRVRGARSPVLQPFVADRPPADPALTGNVFAAGTFATASSAMTGAGALGASGAHGPSASVSEAHDGTGTFLTVGAALPPFVDTTAAAAAAGRYPSEKTQDIAYTNPHSQPGPSGQVSRQSSQYISPIDTQLPPSEKRREMEALSPSTMLSPSTILSPSSVLSRSDTQASTSARERYLEQRLATLEAHVATYLPPPYEQPES